MSPRIILPCILSTLLAVAAVISARADAPPVVTCPTATAPAIRDGDRVVFVGDSITGQGGNQAEGWTHLMADALAKTHAAAPPTLIPLGGSGQTVGSWGNIEKNSREKTMTLDVKAFDVKATLDVHADVVVIMLGMNDVLSPSLSGDEVSFDKWAVQYRELITAIRARTTPRVLALATVPMCTEDENSPKNQAIAALTRRITAIAKDENALVLPVHQTELEVLARGRKLQPDFHISGDFVHPNAAGHLAIAVGMLRGLGEVGAAKAVEDGFGAKVWAAAAPKQAALSYTIDYLPTVPNSDIQSCQINYFYNRDPAETGARYRAPEVRLQVPAGWTVKPAVVASGKGAFTVTGPFDRLSNPLVLRSERTNEKLGTSISLPAPWLIGTAGLRQFTWGAGNSNFDPEKSKLPFDEKLLRGEGWGEALEVAPGQPMRWQQLHPSVNNLGDASPGSVDMMTVTFFQSFEVGYGARWLYSDRERPVNLKLGSAAFGGNDYLAVYVNGANVYSSSLMKDRGKSVPATLRKGWNALTFKSNHLQWQWHLSIDLAGADGDDLGDVRVSTVAKPTPPVPAM